MDSSASHSKSILWFLKAFIQGQTPDLTRIQKALLCTAFSAANSEPHSFLSCTRRVVFLPAYTLKFMLRCHPLQPAIEQATRRKTQQRPGAAPWPWLQLSFGFNSKVFGRACLKPLQEAWPCQEFANNETGGVASLLQRNGLEADSIRATGMERRFTLQPWQPEGSVFPRYCSYLGQGKDWSLESSSLQKECLLLLPCYLTLLWSSKSGNQHLSGPTASAAASSSP